jgi:hypothetical protein
MRLLKGRESPEEFRGALLVWLGQLIIALSSDFCYRCAWTCRSWAYR